MKRHAALVILSREHHDGLLLALRLQQGERALERLWSHDTRWQAGEVVRFFREHLERHFADEEGALFPLAERHLRDTALVARLRDEHATLRALADRLRSPEADPRPLLRQFGELLERHIRCEERELFPACEEQIPDGELAQLEIRR